MERRSEAFQASIEALRTEVIALRVEVTTLKQINKDVSELWIAYEKLNKILVTGNGVPSLQEVVRGMSKTLDEHVSAQNEKDKTAAAQWDKLKWLLVAVFIGQAAIFIFGK